MTFTTKIKQLSNLGLGLVGLELSTTRRQRVETLRLKELVARGHCSHFGQDLFLDDGKFLKISVRGLRSLPAAIRQLAEDKVEVRVCAKTMCPASTELGMRGNSHVQHSCKACAHGFMLRHIISVRRQDVRLVGAI